MFKYSIGAGFSCVNLFLNTFDSANGRADEVSLETDAAAWNQDFPALMSTALHGNVLMT